MPTTRKYNKPTKRTATRYTKTGTKTARTTRTTRSHSPTTYSCTAVAYKRPRQECQWRLGSYKNVYSLFNGAAKQTMFSPTNVNKWVKFINNGYRVYKFSTSDFGKYFGSQWNTNSPTACQKWMKHKYGSGIKAVARGSQNTWLIAATPTITARPFQTYNWWK